MGSASVLSSQDPEASAPDSTTRPIASRPARRQD